METLFQIMETLRELCYAILGPSNASSVESQANMEGNQKTKAIRTVQYHLATGNIYTGFIIACLGFIMVFDCKHFGLGIDAMISGILILIPVGVFGRFANKYPSFNKNILYMGLFFVSGAVCLNVLVYAIIETIDMRFDNDYWGNRYRHCLPKGLLFTDSILTMLLSFVGFGIAIFSLTSACLRECTGYKGSRHSTKRRRSTKGYRRLHRYYKK